MRDGGQDGSEDGHGSKGKLGMAVVPTIKYDNS